MTALPSKFLGTKDGVELHNLQINYLISLQGDDVKLDSSSEAYKWIELNELESSNLDDFSKSVARQAFLDVS